MSKAKADCEAEDTNRMRIWARVKSRIGKAVFPRKSVGKKVMRVPGTFRKTKDDKDVLLAAAWMKCMISKGEFKGKSKGGKLKIISCEFDDSNLIKSAIQNGFEVEVICSNNIFYYQLLKIIRSSNWRYRMLGNDVQNSCIDKRSTSVVIYKIPTRAKQHGMLAEISGKYYLLLEDPHESDAIYESALLVEEATSEFVNNYFINNFTIQLKKSMPYRNMYIEYCVNSLEKNQ